MKSCNPKREQHQTYSFDLGEIDKNSPKLEVWPKQEIFQPKREIQDFVYSTRFPDFSENFKEQQESDEFGEIVQKSIEDNREK